MARKPRRFVLGDIHGEYDYLLEVLKLSGIDPEVDELIQIGDIVDRGSEPFKCMDELLKFKNLTLIVGNHDQGFREFTRGGFNLLAAYPQNGVDITNIKWKELSDEQKTYYKENIFEKMKDYHEIGDLDILFVHGGFDPSEPIEIQDAQSLTWDRELVQEMWYNALKRQNKHLVGNYKKVFIGHTPTLYFGVLEPIISGGGVNVDTGCGKGGPLTIMDIDTLEYWQSNYSPEIKQYVQKLTIKSAEEEKIEETEEGTSEGEVKIAA